MIVIIVIVVIIVIDVITIGVSLRFTFRFFLGDLVHPEHFVNERAVLCDGAAHFGAEHVVIVVVVLAVFVLFVVFVPFQAQFHVLLLVYHFLLFVDVLVDELAFGQRCVVWENARVRFVVLEEPRETNRRLGRRVKAFEELGDVVDDQVVLELGHDVRLFVVDDIVYHSRVVVNVIDGVRRYEGGVHLFNQVPQRGSC